MNQYKSNYIEENQKSFKRLGNSKSHKMYKNHKSVGHKKPKKVIITEIYDEVIPKNNNYIKNKENLNYNTESSIPLSNRQNLVNMSQNKIVSKYNYNLTEQENTNVNTNITNMDRNVSDYGEYNKQLYFGGTDLREEFSPLSSKRIDIRKKVYRVGTPQHTYQNRKNINFENEQKFVENFRYHESKNIKDESNKKYESITRVTGYSNLIPLNRRRNELNYTSRDIYRNENDYFNQISSSRYQNLQQLQHNFSNADMFKRSEIYKIKSNNQEPRKTQSEEKITTVEVKKTSQIYENKRQHQSKPLPTVKNSVVQPKKPEEKKITNVYLQKKTEKKYEINKKSQIPKKTTTIQTQSITNKYESKRKFEKTKNASSTNITIKNNNKNNKTNQKSKIKINIDTSKYINPNGEKLYFKRGHGRYTYKECLSEKDILNSRKTGQSGNTKRISIVETRSKDKYKKTNINNKTSHKKVENTSKVYNTSKTNNTSKVTNTTKITSTSNINNGYNSKSNRRAKESETFTKKTISIPSNTNNRRNKEVTSMNKTNVEIQKRDLVNQYINNVKKLDGDRNMEYIEQSEIYKMEESKKKETTPKTKLKNLGDNYQYYEAKYVPNQGDIISSYTLHQRRNQRVIYGKEEVDDNDYNKNEPQMKGYYTKSKKIVKRSMMPFQGAQNQYQNHYITHEDYYEGNGYYNGDGECEGYNDYEYEIEKPHFYCQ